MQDAEALERIAFELVEAKAADRVRYVEIRWGPLLHVRHGLPLADGIAARLPWCPRRGRAPGRRGPAHRHGAPLARAGRQRRASRLAAAEFRDEGLTGFDLAGPEAAFPDPLVHAAAFEAARGGRPADHPPRRRVGRRGAGPARARARPGPDRPRPERRR